MEINEKIVKLKIKEAELKEQLATYEAQIPVNNMGKWSRSVAIESYKQKIAKVESKIKDLHKNKNEQK